jgi:NADH-quinone oxidoreductase subunit C
MRDLLTRLQAVCPAGTSPGELLLQRHDLAFVTLPAAALRPALQQLRDREGYTHLVLLTAVDWIEDGVFQLTYLLAHRGHGRNLGLRVMIERPAEGSSGLATMESIHDLWPTAATYQRELREMFGIDFPGSPRVDEEFILEGWRDLPPYRRDFDTLAYSQANYADRPGRSTHDPESHMREQLHPGAQTGQAVKGARHV